MKQFMLKTIQYLRSRTQVDTTSGATIPARYEELLIVKQQILKSDSLSEREKHACTQQRVSKQAMEKRARNASHKPQKIHNC